MMFVGAADGSFQTVRVRQNANEETSRKIVNIC